MGTITKEYAEEMRATMVQRQGEVQAQYDQAVSLMSAAKDKIQAFVGAIEQWDLVLHRDDHAPMCGHTPARDGK